MHGLYVQNYQYLVNWCRWFFCIISTFFTNIFHINLMSNWNFCVARISTPCAVAICEWNVTECRGREIDWGKPWDRSHLQPWDQWWWNRCHLKDHQMITGPSNNHHHSVDSHFTKSFTELSKIQSSETKSQMLFIASPMPELLETKMRDCQTESDGGKETEGCKKSGKKQPATYFSFHRNCPAKA